MRCLLLVSMIACVPESGAGCDRGRFLDGEGGCVPIVPEDYPGATEPPPIVEALAWLEANCVEGLLSVEVQTDGWALDATVHILDVAEWEAAAIDAEVEEHPMDNVDYHPDGAWDLWTAELQAGGTYLPGEVSGHACAADQSVFVSVEMTSGARLCAVAGDPAPWVELGFGDCALVEEAP